MQTARHFNDARRWFHRLCAQSVLIALPMLVVSASWRTAETQRLSSHQDSDSLRLLFSFSGGISLGAYQAGVNWATLEVIKRARAETSFRDEMLGKSPAVNVMTGASAGNINVLLGAIEYCDTAFGNAPDRSLLWRMWVGTGWDDLFPVERDTLAADDGMLERGRIKENVLRQVRRDMRSRKFRPGCTVPIGVVVTRVADGTIRYDRHIGVRNQRYVALFDARVRNGEMWLVRPDPTFLQRRSFGAQIMLPVESGDVIDPERVFEVVEASSSYPVAFAPVRIPYEDPHCAADGEGGCEEWKRERFMDGGVFDNNPVKLAIGLDRLRDSLRSKMAALTLRDPSVQNVVYVDPDAARSRLHLDQQRRAKAAAESQDEGAMALMRFVSGFVPSARNYELQTFIRDFADLPATQRPNILSSTRAHPVVGEHLGAFAAFLGRPFREFDFYVGVVDGARFVAQTMICPHVERTEEALEPCVREHTTALISNELRLDPVGRIVALNVLRRGDYHDLEVAPISSLDSDAERQRALVLNAIGEAAYGRLADRRLERCPLGDLPKLVLCADGFGKFLERLTPRDTVVDIVEEWADACRPDDECMAERDLAKLIRNPHAAMQDVVDRALWQLHATESALDDRERPNLAFPMKTVEFLIRSADHQSRRGLDLEPSSIPPHTDRRHWPLRFVPYFVGGTVGANGLHFGWQPTYHTGYWSTYGALQVEGAYAAPGFEPDAERQWYVVPTLTVGRDLAKVWLNQVGVGVRLERDRGERRFVSTSPKPTVEVTSLWLLGKVRASAYYMPASAYFAQRGKWVGTLALADLNGILYWVLR